MTPTIYDKAGIRRDWAWLTGKYGALDYLPSRHQDQAHFDLVEVRETTGITNCFVQVNQEDGHPWDGVMVILTWPSLESPAMDLPSLTGGDPAVDQWSVRGIAQFTGNGGNTGFGLGSQSWIKGSPATGPYSVWLFHKSFGSACFTRFGWMGGTDHDGPCRLVFQMKAAGSDGGDGGDGDGGDGGDGGGGTGDYSEVVAVLKQIRDAIKAGFRLS